MYSELVRIAASGRLHALKKRPRSGGAALRFSSPSQPARSSPSFPLLRREEGGQSGPRLSPSLPRRRRLAPPQSPGLAPPGRRVHSTAASREASLFPPQQPFVSVSSLSCDRDGDEEEHDDDDRDAAGLFTLVGGYPSSAPAYERLLSSRGPPSSSSRMLSSRRANRGGGGATGAGTNSRGNGTAATTISSLDLELGEASIWDRRVAGFGVPRDDDSDVDDEDEDASGGDDDVGQAAGAVDAQRRFAGGAPVEDLSGLFARPGSEEGMARSRRRRRRSAVELLAQFDPQRPPESDDPIDLQLWLECEAQQEAVLRYQKLIDQARERGDYGSLSIVQRQILRWYPSLLSEISDRQRDYVLKRTDARHYRSAKRYGPYLCALPAEKMAVIAAHESILYCLIKSGLHGKEGVPFVGLAHRLGAAVEEEVVVHRALHKRWIESSKRRQQQEDADEEGTVRDLLPQEFDEGSSVEADEESDDEESTDDDEEEGEGGLSSTSSNFAHVTHQWSYAASHLKTFLDEINQRQPTAKKRRVIAYAIRRARQILEKEAEWTTEEKVHLGAALFQIILEKATVSYDGKEEMAFTYEKRWYHSLNKLKSFVKLNERLYDMVVSDKLQSFHATTTRFKPTIIPPKPWRGVNNGAYLWLRADLMRFHGCKMQKEALMNADLSTVYDGLNALGRVPWKINRRVLAVAQRCWDDNIPLGDIPSRTDFELPAQPVPPEKHPFQHVKESPEYKLVLEQQRGYREALGRYSRIRQKNNDLISLRCSAMLKLDQAQKFEEFDEIYFPYNMDFRGRAYPIPPHLSNVGSDLCRGMLMFAHPKPLGPRGLRWLKIHLANVAGKDKMTFDQRAEFVDEHMDSVRESATDPFAGSRWWMKLEDPFQGLATCIEIINAIDSGEPEKYECSLAVHMDGSCNGLQHYAALGRDMVGGKAVNLCATGEPQDVYIGVMHEVIRRVSEEAKRNLGFESDNPDSLSREQKKALSNNRAAKLVDGLIDRGVVKRTVMTSVYGVTFVGARQQIQEKIESKLEDKGYDIDEINYEVFQACGYLAQVTMDVMGDLFQGARQTMNWLTTCARLITQHGYPVAWLSPIGLPALQPYRQKKSSTLVTLLQTVTLIEDGDDLPIHKQRQVSAFPPNYVHSLDSSHMLLTALEMERRGLTFSAVHDSFWTHACDVDEMNVALRDVFVDLYEQPLLEQLLNTWKLRYPEIDFPDVPERGSLDLNEIKESKYFFQ